MINGYNRTAYCGEFNESHIGQEAVVLEAIDNIKGKGAVKLLGKVWSAVSADGSVINENELVTVQEIRGVKLVCIKK